MKTFEQKMKDLENMDPKCMSEFVDVFGKIAKMSDALTLCMHRIHELEERLELLEEVKEKGFDSDNSSFGPSVPPVKG
jgi:DNA repair ATPase RecN